MSLPVTNLDDRKFQDLVDEAKRMIPQLCPEWTNHNLSDPGVALIELFAWMTETMLFRLNQVPDVFYTRMLNLLGFERFPAAAARVRSDVLEHRRRDPSAIAIPAGTQVATSGTIGDTQGVHHARRHRDRARRGSLRRSPPTAPIGTSTSGTTCSAGLTGVKCLPLRADGAGRRVLHRLRELARRQRDPSQHPGHRRGHRRQPRAPAAGVGGLAGRRMGRCDHSRAARARRGRRHDRRPQPRRQHHLAAGRRTSAADARRRARSLAAGPSAARRR